MTDDELMAIEDVLNLRGKPDRETIAALVTEVRHLREACDEWRKTADNAMDRYHAAQRMLEGVTKDLDEAQRSKDHTEYWYAARTARLRRFAEENGWLHEYCNIMANGTAELHEPPTAAQLINIARHERDAALAQVAALREAATLAVDLLRRPKHPHSRAENALGVLDAALARGEGK